MKLLTAADEVRLRETLRHYSATTYLAAREFRKTGNVDYLRGMIDGILERNVEAESRAKLEEASDQLRLGEDLGLDSLTMIEIVLLLENILDVSLANTPQSCRTLGDFRQWLETTLFGLGPMNSLGLEHHRSHP